MSHHTCVLSFFYLFFYCQSTCMSNCTYYYFFFFSPLMMQLHCIYLQKSQNHTRLLELQYYQASKDDYNSIHATLSLTATTAVVPLYSTSWISQVSDYFSVIQGPELCRHFKYAHIMFILPVNNFFYSTASSCCSLMLNCSTLPMFYQLF